MPVAHGPTVGRQAHEVSGWALRSKWKTDQRILQFAFATARPWLSAIVFAHHRNSLQTFSLRSSLAVPRRLYCSMVIKASTCNKHRTSRICQAAAGWQLFSPVQVNVSPVYVFLLHKQLDLQLLSQSYSAAVWSVCASSACLIRCSCATDSPGPPLILSFRPSYAAIAVGSSARQLATQSSIPRATRTHNGATVRMTPRAKKSALPRSKTAGTKRPPATARQVSLQHARKNPRKTQIPVRRVCSP